MSDGQDQQKYSAGERVLIGIDLSDDSGIYDVTGFFVHSDDSNAAITLPGYGGGARRATVYIQNFVTTNTPPGQYVCQYVQAQDGRGNYSTLHPDISFCVDQQSAPVDDQGPEMGGWSFPPEKIQVAEMPVIEAERRPELTASVTNEGTGAGVDTREDAPKAPAPPEDTEGDEQEGNALQLIEGKMDEMAADITEDTGGHGDLRLHSERRMDEMAKEMTEETGGHGDIRKHAQRRMDEMAQDMFED